MFKGEKCRKQHIRKCEVELKNYCDYNFIEDENRLNRLLDI